MCLTATTIAAGTAAGQGAAAAAEPAAAPAIDARRLEIRVGELATVAGRAAPGSGAALQVRRQGRWDTLARARSAATGRFVLRARVRRATSVPARVRLADGAARSVGRLNVYRVAIASWYGPGLYGNRTGCGGRLWPGRLGVAHRTLPCGSLVTIRHRARVVRVPVIDRGPYVGAREYDLTAETARRLRFHGYGAILTTR